MSDNGTVLNDEHVLRYLSLVDRRLYIVMHSGVSWKPEFAQELEDIDREIAELRKIIDAAHDDRDAASSEGPLPCSDEHDDLDFDAIEQLQLDAEVRQARLNGGRTDYLFDDDGNEYYTTVDGRRHYTRLEG